MAERKKIFYAFSLYTFLTSHYPSTSKGYKDNGFARSMRKRDTGLLKKYRDFFKSIENLFLRSHYPSFVKIFYFKKSCSLFFCAHLKWYYVSFLFGTHKKPFFAFKKVRRLFQQAIKKNQYFFKKEGFIC